MSGLFLFSYLMIAMTILSVKTANAQELQHKWDWQILPAVPDDIGFAGAFAGAVEGGLVVAGGANFPNGKLPADGGVKRWTDRVFLWEEQLLRWKEIGRLPMPLGYGASASYDGKLYIAGGSHATGHTNVVYCLTFAKSGIVTQELPKLPLALANTSSVLIGSIWYVVGGITDVDAQQAVSSCFSLDLRQPHQGWQVCPALPGMGRMLAVVGTDGHDLYVFSGVALVAGQRKYLRDVYRYSTIDGWQLLSALDSAVVAAPSPAFFGEGCFWIFGGDDGSLAGAPLGQGHPGFSKLIRMFDPARQRWSTVGQMTLPAQEADSPHANVIIQAPVTTTAVATSKSIMLVMGEVKPGIRTTQVLKGTLTK